MPLRSHQVVHELLYLPDCPVPLLGRDLLAEMGAEIAFTLDGSARLRLDKEVPPMILSLPAPREEEYEAVYLPIP